GGGVGVGAGGGPSRPAAKYSSGSVSTNNPDGSSRRPSSGHSNAHAPTSAVDSSRVVRRSARRHATGRGGPIEGAATEIGGGRGGSEGIGDCVPPERNASSAEASSGTKRRKSPSACNS